MTFPLACKTTQFAAVRGNAATLAVAARRQVECQANCVKIFRLAGLRIDQLLGLLGNDLLLRWLALRILTFRRSDCRGDRLVPLSIGDARPYGCHGCSRQGFQSRQRFGLSLRQRFGLRQDFNWQAIRLCQFGCGCGFGCGSSIGKRRQPICFCESFLNRICNRCAFRLRTSGDRSVGVIEMTKSKPERTYARQDNEKCQAEPNSPDHIEPPLAGSVASEITPENRNLARQGRRSLNTGLTVIGEHEKFPKLDPVPANRARNSQQPQFIFSHRRGISVPARFSIAAAASSARSSR